MKDLYIHCYESFFRSIAKQNELERIIKEYQVGEEITTFDGDKFKVKPNFRSIDYIIIYIRSNYTDYENILDFIKGKVGTNELYLKLRERL